jgi:hypothetical protein
MIRAVLGKLPNILLVSQTANVSKRDAHGEDN